MQTDTGIILFKKGQVFTDDFKIANIFNHFFINITDSLELKVYTTHIRPNVGVDEHVHNARDKYHSHPSIHTIKNAKITKETLLSTKDH